MTDTPGSDVKSMRIYLFFLILLITTACGGNEGTANINSAKNGTGNLPSNKTMPASVPIYTYEIVKAFPHDPNSFTQGLVFHEGTLYESAGEYGRSSLRKVDLETGKIIKKYDVPKEYFAEGMTIFNNKIYQVTWREGTAFVYDISDFTLLRQLRYQGDGWGLTHDGTNLILSDGTHVIRFADPETFQTVRTIVVKRENGQPLMDINELEYVKGEIWANIWHSEDPHNLGKQNYIARIDPQNGKILGWIDLGGISPEDTGRDPENTLNGIAYDAAADRIFVTGKKWKKVFEIKVSPK